ncbi:MAG: Abi-alpha family protein [Bacteroidota bacterium]|nr:Abi-alpha family protein [Bacteroidota bacterium]
MSEDKKIDITSTAVEKGFDLIKDFLGKIIGPPIEEVGLLLADNIRIFRFRNQINLLKKAEKIAKEKKIDIKKVSLKILVPLLENASLEENDDLQDRWANLLVNYIDSRQNLRSTVFPYILGQLSSEEANALDFIREKGIVDYMKLNIYDAETSNLVRLGVIRQLTPRAKIKDVKYQGYGEDDYNETVVVYDDNDIRFEITELGSLFVDSCKINK